MLVSFAGKSILEKPATSPKERRNTLELFECLNGHLPTPPGKNASKYQRSQSEPALDQYQRAEINRAIRSIKSGTAIKTSPEDLLMADTERTANSSTRGFYGNPDNVISKASSLLSRCASSAELWKNADIVEQLSAEDLHESALKKIASTNLIDLDRLLLSTAKRGHAHNIEPLLELGADIHATDKKGWTATQLAARTGNPKTVALLTRHGGVNDYPDILSQLGQTYLDDENPAEKSLAVKKILRAVPLSKTLDVTA
jgi:hypothetical protein